MKLLGVGWLARSWVGNSKISAEIRQSSTKLDIKSFSSAGKLEESHLLDGVVRDRKHMDSDTLVKALVEEQSGDVVVEVVWKLKGLTTVDRRELVTRTRMRQVRFACVFLVGPTHCLTCFACMPADDRGAAWRRDHPPHSHAL